MATMQEISDQIRSAGLDAVAQGVEIEPNKQDKLPGGAGDNAMDSAFNPEALAEGIKHEMEHTNDEQLAKEIAKDHLTEDPNYYSKLKQMQLSNIDLEIFRLMAAGSKQ